MTGNHQEIDKDPLCYMGGGGGLDGIPPTVFDMLQYFETILPSVESL